MQDRRADRFTISSSALVTILVRIIWCVDFVPPLRSFLPAQHVSTTRDCRGNSLRLIYNHAFGGTA